MRWWGIQMVIRLKKKMKQKDGEKKEGEIFISRKNHYQGNHTWDAPPHYREGLITNG